MVVTILAIGFLTLFVLAYAAWRRYLWVAGKPPQQPLDDCPYSLTNRFPDQPLLNAPQQADSRWLTDIFSRSAERYPDLTALQIPATGESLTFAELDARADAVAAALSPLLTGPDQVVTVAMEQDNWQIIACHLGILRAGGAVMFLDATLPESLISHMLEDAQPVVVLTRGQNSFRDLPVIDVLTLPGKAPKSSPACWMDDPAQRLATLFYTSGTTGLPKGVESAHAGYVNLALSYADYYDLVPGMDATSLTSSLGYDGSISEMYSAWVSGCAVVLLTREQVRSGPDLLPVLRAAEVTVLFCPPVLLTTLSSNPELDLPYPLCRYIVPAGEAFPAALVEPWTRGRRQVINTYGPTEASTDTSRQSLRPGEPVTIGSPFPNVTYVILEVGGQRPLPHGETGELCIGGVHVARGYRNLPDQTASQFITHPQFGRLYRTGDKCRIDPRSHQVHFLGRVDAQIKVRGHRVEIQPVEDMLQSQFGEIEAAVLDYQNEELVAFVRAPSLPGQGADAVAPAPLEWAAQVRQKLAAQLPPPSVPDRIFLVEQFVLKPLSGKIDRQRIPDLAQLLNGGGSAPVDEPDGVVLSDTDAGQGSETGEVLAICRDVVDASLGWDDAFADHGGHSIVIARLVHRLRKAGWEVTVRDLLSDCDTARKVAERARELQHVAGDENSPLDGGSRHAPCDVAAAKILSTRRFTVLQVLFLLLLYLPGILGLAGVVAAAEIGEFFVTAHLGQFIVVGILMYLIALVLPFASLLWVIVIKFLLRKQLHRKKLKPGIYPRWSRMHLRVWCIRRLEMSVIRPLAAMLRSARLLAWVLRRLGATVGNNVQCANDAELLGPLTLLQIEDNVAIQTGACISTSRWLGQELHVGPVHLERGCKIGMRAGVANDVTVGRGSWVTPLASVLHDVGAEEMWEGAPARFAGRCTRLQRTADRCQYQLPPWAMETLNILMQVVLEICLLVLPTALITWLGATFIPSGGSAESADYFRVTPLPEIVWQIGLYAFATSWATIILISLLGCLFIRFTPSRPGLHPAQGLGSALLLYRVKKLNQVQRLWTWTITGQYLRALAGLRFKRVGASECDVMQNLVPELVTADSQVFWSHGCFTNVLDYGAEHLKLSHLDMPLNFFASNNCVAEYGQLPTNFLLGVSTPGNDILFRRQVRSRLDAPSTVAGNPPLKFASSDFEAENEAQELPGFSLFLARFFLSDVFSIGMLPIAEVLIYTIIYTVLLRFGEHPVMSALLALLFTEGVLLVLSLLVKQVFVGNKWGSDHSTSFWSVRHFTYFFAQDCFFAWCKRPLGTLSGTVLANVILRRMGCRIGRRTIINSPLQAFDWNAVNFGDDCIIDGMLQLHTFENMMLRVKRSDIRSGSTINFGATVMGGAVIGPGTTLLPLSLVLKSMHLPTAVYHGSPAEPVSGSQGAR